MITILPISDEWLRRYEAVAPGPTHEVYAATKAWKKRYDESRWPWARAIYGSSGS